MNDMQHNASVEVQMAQAEVNTCAEKLATARQRLRLAEAQLDGTIRRDPGSWYATPHTQRETVEP